MPAIPICKLSLFLSPMMLVMCKYASLMHGLFYNRVHSLRQRRERQAQGVLHFAHPRHRPLHRDRIGFDEQVAMASEQLVIESRAPAQLRHSGRRHTSHASVSVRRSRSPKSYRARRAALKPMCWHRHRCRWRNPSERAATDRCAFDVPVASLMPTMLGICARRSTVSLFISATVRPGTL